MIVCAVCDERVSQLFEFCLERFGVFDYLLLVELEFFGLCLFQSHSQRGDGVVVWTTLVAWEDGEIDGFFEIVEGFFAGFGVCAADAFAEEDHGATWSAKGFVGCGCHDIGGVKRRWNHTCGNQT